MSVAPWKNVIVTRKSRVRFNRKIELYLQRFVNCTVCHCLFVCLPELSVSGYKSTPNNRPGRSQQSFTSIGETIKAYRFPFVEETSWSSPLGLETIKKMQPMPHSNHKWHWLLIAGTIHFRSVTYIIRSDYSHVNPQPRSKWSPCKLLWPSSLLRKVCEPVSTCSHVTTSLLN